MKSFVKLNVLLFIMSFFLFACSFDTSNETSITFTMDRSMVQNISDAAGLPVCDVAGTTSLVSQEEELFVDISLHGDYEDSKTLRMEAGASASFYGIKFGKKIYAVLSVYKISDGTRIDLLEERSEEIIVRPSKNKLTFRIRKSDLSIKIYVSASALNDEIPDGSKEKPFGSISEALASISDLNQNYTIFVDGTLSQPQTVESSVFAKSITIEGLNGLDSDGIPKDCLGGNTRLEFPALTILTTTPVIIKNIKISSGIVGIKIGTPQVAVSADVTISEGTLVTQNYDTGVFVSSGATLKLAGGTVSNTLGMQEGNSSGCGISSNGTFIMTSGSVKNNRGTWAKGGIDINRGTANISGGTISGNGGSMGGFGGILVGSNAQASFGAVEIVSNGISDGSCNGAGIRINSTAHVTMVGTIIKKNSATAGMEYETHGGGIYNQGTLEMTNCIVSENFAQNGGGGIYNDRGTITMKDCLITKNKVSMTGLDYFYPKGGGIINFLGSITMDGGVISENIAHDIGKGVYNNGTFILKGDALITPSGEGANDFCLSNYNLITIGSHLTQDHVAEIVLPQLSDGGQSALDVQVLTLGENSGTTLGAECSKFTVPDDNQNGEYNSCYVSAEGYIQYMQ